MPNGQRVRSEELADILSLFEEQKKTGKPLRACYEAIGELVGRSPDVVRMIIGRLKPTNGLARVYIQSKAMKLAMKVVREANTAQAIDILSRPNMGVLDPMKQTNQEGGFFMSMTADSCGAVKIGVTNQRPPAAIEGEAYAEDAGSPPSTQDRLGSAESALAEAKARLCAARASGATEARGSEDGGAAEVLSGKGLVWGRQRGRNPRLKSGQEDEGLQIIDVNPQD